MCGIFGLFQTGGRAIDTGQCRKAAALMAHRGPDALGEWIGPGGDIYLGFRRLSILDLSAAANQPMHGRDGNVLIFNGEIYNYQTIRQELIAHGLTFRTNGDTEVLLRALETWGEAALPKLEGMFGFLFWDGVRREALIVRDFLGIKPVYWWQPPGGGLAVASEVKCFYALDGFEPRVDRDALPEYLRFRSLAGENTLLAGVRQLRPGHLLRYRFADGTLSGCAYWSPAAAASAAPTPRNPMEELRDLFRSSVDLHLLSDVPVGAQLSGGVDSTLSLAVARRDLKRNMKAFHCSVAGDNDSELPFARRAAQLLDVEMEVVELEAGQMLSPLLDKLTWHMDEPLGHPNALGVHLVSALAKPQATVLISGEGADEIFAGYTRYSGLQRQALARRTGLGSAMAALPLPRSLKKTGQLATMSEDDVIVNGTQFVPADLLKSLLPDADAAAAESNRRALLTSPSEFDALRRCQLFDLGTYLPALLIRQDKMSMAASIENRVPFLTPRMVAFGLSLPEEQRAGLNSQKILLKKYLCDYVPEDLVYRKKVGFRIPLERWLFTSEAGRARLDWLAQPDNPIYDYIDRQAVTPILTNPAAGKDEALTELVWMLLSIGLWMRIFLRKETVLEMAG
jgi:asparagine synthase (glutamine-hydrolysing)